MEGGYDQAFGYGCGCGNADGWRSGASREGQVVLLWLLRGRGRCGRRVARRVDRFTAASLRLSGAGAGRLRCASPAPALLLADPAGVERLLLGLAARACLLLTDRTEQPCRNGRACPGHFASWCPRGAQLFLGTEP